MLSVVYDCVVKPSIYGCQAVGLLLQFRTCQVPLCYRNNLSQDIIKSEAHILYKT